MKKKRPNPYLIDDENPEWTEETFRNAVPAREFFTRLWGEEKAEAFLRANREHIAKKQRGRPRKAQTANMISLRIDPEVERFFRATGQGWQTRLNDVLRHWVQQQTS